MKLGQLIFICLLLTAFFIPHKSEGQTISGVINSYHNVTDIVNGTHNSYSYTGITLESITGLSTGDRVLIIQMKGATIDQTNASTFGNIGSVANVGNAGKYEFSSICGFLNNTIVLSNHLMNSYDVANVQVIRVPSYTNVTISGTLLATEWDPVAETGGVIALEATGTITMSANISADSAGFKGGPLFRNATAHCGPQSAWYYGLIGNQGAPKGEGIATFISNKEYGRGKQANGGGGGNEDNTGGGGGSNYAAGGRGGDKMYAGLCNSTTYGEPGIALSGFGYSSSNNRVFLGGAGGNGESNNNYGGASVSEGTPGGDGGGLIFIKANELIGNGFTISANGAQGVNPDLPVKTEAAGDGGGGGGSAGAVMLNITAYTGSTNIQARGANGSNAGFQSACPGPGGGGGGGIIWASSALPANVTTSVAGGAAGIIKPTTYDPSCEGSTNNATAGSAGIVQSGFVAAQGTNTIDCSILPVDLLKQFIGKRNSTNVQLNWELRNKDAVQKIILEKRTGSEAFKTVYEQFDPQTSNGLYVDEKNNLNVTYRLVLFSLNGERQYSNHVFFEAGERKTLNLYPNPANDNVTIQLPANFIGKTNVVVTDVNGRQVLNQQLFIQSSQINTVVSVKQLPAGIYSIRLENKEGTYSAKLLKQ